MLTKEILIKYLRNNIGQSLVEAALTLSLTIVILFSMIAAGLYVYDMSVFVYATNKALDKGVGMLSGNKPEYHDGIDGNELTGDDKAKIKETALNSLSIRVFTEDITEDDVLVTTEEISGDNEVKLKVKITGTYQFGIPLVDVVFPQLKYECTYIYKIYGVGL